MAKVLLVDDSHQTCWLLSRLLRKVGHQVDCVERGAEALRQLHEAPLPMLVILDYQMPGMNGLEVLQAIRESPVTKSLPVVLYTASDDPAVHAQARHLGVDGIWTKPSLTLDEIDFELRRIADMAVQ